MVLIIVVGLIFFLKKINNLKEPRTPPPPFLTQPPTPGSGPCPIAAHEKKNFSGTDRLLLHCCPLLGFSHGVGFLPGKKKDEDEQRE